MTEKHFDPVNQSLTVHPEQRIREVYIGDYDRWYAESAHIKWKSKRIGDKPLNTSSQNARPEYRMVPVFADRTEVITHHFRLLHGE